MIIRHFSSPAFLEWCIWVCFSWLSFFIIIIIISPLRRILHWNSKALHACFPNPLLQKSANRTLLNVIRCLTTATHLTVKGKVSESPLGKWEVKCIFATQPKNRSEGPRGD